MGESGVGSVERRGIGGFCCGLFSPKTSVEVVISCSRRLGIGEDRNSSIRSVSGTGSMSLLSLLLAVLLFFPFNSLILHKRGNSSYAGR